VTFALAALVLSAVAGSASSAAVRDRPAVSLSASPARIALGGEGQAVVALRNFGSSRVAVTTSRGSFALDRRGRPAVVRRVSTRSAATWLQVRPRALSIGPGGRSLVTVTAHLPARAEPGDHHALVLFATRATQAGQVGVRMRIGVRVVVRAPGTVVRKLVIRGLRVRRAGRARVLDVALANRGNVTETLPPGRLTISLRVGRRTLARLRGTWRELLPHSSGTVTARYARNIRGRVLAAIEIRGAGRRTFWIRL
jgi:hypothetical protein